MPLRDHFRPPLADDRSWEGFHGGWPMMIVAALNRVLPGRYVAEPQVHLGASIEVDVATYEGDDPAPIAQAGGGFEAAAAWSPPEPTLAVATGLPDLDEYSVLVHDSRRGRRLVAAVEIVSPANNDRPEHRRAFVANCSALLQARVSVAIVDIVTTRNANLYGDLLDFIGQAAPPPVGTGPPPYAVACRSSKKAEALTLETWAHALEVGRELPTLPLWLADDFAVPLELERSYEETCRILRIA